MAAKRIKLVTSLLAGGSRLLAPGTIIEHPNPDRLIAKGVAVEVTGPEAEGDEEGEEAPAQKRKGKKRPEPAGE